MIPARHQQLAFVFFMTLLMGLVLSFVFEAQAGVYGFNESRDFVASWLQRFFGTYVIVLPVVVVVNPIAKWLTSLVVAKHEARS